MCIFKSVHYEGGWIVLLINVFSCSFAEVSKDNEEAEQCETDRNDASW